MEKQILQFDSSWDDGASDDVRIARLLRRHKLPGTFYIPSICDLSALEIMMELTEFDIGGHTVNHPEDLKLLDEDQLLYEIEENKRWLESITGKEITKFAYPGGRYNDETINILRKCGFTEGRTTLVLKTEARDAFRHDTTIHVYPRREYQDLPWIDIAKFWAKEVSQKGGYFHIWGHSADLNRFKYWDQLDEFFGWLNDNYEIKKYENIHTN